MYEGRTSSELGDVVFFWDSGSFDMNSLMSLILSNKGLLQYLYLWHTMYIYVMVIKILIGSSFPSHILGFRPYLWKSIENDSYPLM